MMLAVTVIPRAEPLMAWQFTGQPATEWPAWVSACCTVTGLGGLRHERVSGAQIVYPSEWLIQGLDGDVNFYTDAEREKLFRVVDKPKRVRTKV